MARRLGVTQQDVVRAALAVVDRDGLERLTVAAVAAEVGCRAPSVYHHVSGLDGLRVAVAEVAARELLAVLEDTNASGSGAAVLRSQADACRTWALAHPGRFAVLVVPVSNEDHPELAATRARLLAAPRRALRRAGVDAADDDRWLAALVAAVRGAVAIAADGEPGDPAAREAAGTMLIDGLLRALPG